MILELSVFRSFKHLYYDLEKQDYVCADFRSILTSIHKLYLLQSPKLAECDVGVNQAFKGDL